MVAYPPLMPILPLLPISSLLIGSSTERASDLSRRASEPFGMAFEIAFKTAGRVSVPSERALEPYGRGCSEPVGKRGRDMVRQ